MEGEHQSESSEIIEVPQVSPEVQPRSQKPKAKPKQLECPHCGGSVTIKAVGATINVVCGSCSSVLDVSQEQVRVVLESNAKTKPTLLELGVRGKLRGVTWEVIGYTEKTDGSGEYHWDEYLLYNPYQGYRFLVQSQGHWSYVKVLRCDVSPQNKLAYDGNVYKLFLMGTAKVAYVKGEFYWQVKKGETVGVADYIAPPLMLSVERNAEEITVSQGFYLEPDEVAEAFKLDVKKMPRKFGVAANQPSPYQGKLGKIWLVAVVALVLGLLLQIGSTATSAEEKVFATQAYLNPSQKNQAFSTQSFVISKESNVEIRSSAPVQNDWVELGLTLVNEKTNETFSATQAIEYYYGTDSDGAWSEGDQKQATFISHVPAGNYRVLIEADAGAFARNADTNFDIKLYRDVPTWSNFIVFLMVLLLYPVFIYLRRSSFETKRWEESDVGSAAIGGGSETVDIGRSTNTKTESGFALVAIVVVGILTMIVFPLAIVFIIPIVIYYVKNINKKKI